MAGLLAKCPSCGERRFLAASACGEHRRRIVRHDDAPVAPDGDDASSGAALAEFLLEGLPVCRSEVRARIADPGCDFVGHYAPDEGLSGACPRYRPYIIPCFIGI